MLCNDAKHFSKGMPVPLTNLSVSGFERALFNQVPHRSIRHLSERIDAHVTSLPPW
jgi:hypothetical protein